MARAPKSIREKYFSPFPVALRGLMERHPVTTQEKLATITGKKRQTISQYVNGTSEPGYETLIKIADYFDVPLDYLLGRSNDPANTRSAVDELGLTPRAIEWLMDLKRRGVSLDFCKLIARSSFRNLVANLLDYATVTEAEVIFDYLLAKYFPENMSFEGDEYESANSSFTKEFDRILSDSDDRIRSALRTMNELINAEDTPLIKYLMGTTVDGKNLLLSDMSSYRINQCVHELQSDIYHELMNKELQRRLDLQDEE